MVLMSWLVFMRLLFTAVVVSMSMISITCMGCSDLTMNFDRLSECHGQAGNDSSMITVDNLQRVECAKVCYAHYQCILLFYNSRARSCSLYNRTLTDIEMIPDDSSVCYMDNNIVESWINEIINVSSSKVNNPATNLIGKSDSKAWGQSYIRQKDVIEVRFSSEMYIKRIYIYEVNIPGGVYRISFLTPNGTWHKVWKTEKMTRMGNKGRILSPDIETTDFKTSTIRMDIGGRSECQYIDAVRVIGKHRLSQRIQDP